MLRYMYHNPTVSMIRRNVFHMQVCIILEQMGHIKGYLLPLGEQLYKAFKDARKRTSASFLYDKEKLLDHILNENRGNTARAICLGSQENSAEFTGCNFNRE